MKSDVISYSKQTIDNDDIKAVNIVLRSAFLTQGPTVFQFENLLKKVTGSKFCIAVNSGTAALHLTCLSIGLKKDDEVITSPLSFVATSNSVLYCGAKPIFADIDEYGLLSPKEAVKKITKKTKAIITVDYAGIPSHLSELKKICQKHNLYLIEDAAHSLGATYRKSTIGSIADLTCFSFHPVKTITTGEGGAVTTDDNKLYKKLKVLKTHGITKYKNDFYYEPDGPWYYEMHYLGYNYRITDFQAALGISQLKKITQFIKARTIIANTYNKAFKKLEEEKLVILPKVRPGTTSAWHLYALRINFQKIKYSKKDLFELFRKEGILLQVHYIPIYKHPYYQKNYKYLPSSYSETESFYNQEISLPIYPSLSQDQQSKVISTVDTFILP